MYSAIVPLTIDTILSLITPYDIFRKYIPGYEPQMSLSSPFDKDSHPSFWSRIDEKGNIWFKDYARKISGDCFTLVMEIYKCNFYTALEHINTDFNLGLNKSNTDFNSVQAELKKFHIEAPKPKQLANIQIASRQWTIQDLQFWAEHGISANTLNYFGVHPISFYWIRDYKFAAERLAYSWMVYNKRKIYQPYSENHKWYGDLQSNYVQGLQFLPKHGKRVIIQSSLKDIMSVVERYNIPGVAGSSETTPIPEFILDDLDRRFEEIYVLHDGDTAGWESAAEL